MSSTRSDTERRNFAASDALHFNLLASLINTGERVTLWKGPNGFRISIGVETVPISTPTLQGAIDAAVFELADRRLKQE